MTFENDKGVPVTFRGEVEGDDATDLAKRAVFRAEKEGYSRRVWTSLVVVLERL